WETEYRFHTRFVMSAKSYFDLEREEAPFVPFYTTVPNYGQMSKGQFDCFVCWRTHIRRGEATPTSPGYVSLMFFEIINLPDLIPPETGRKYLRTMWKSMSLSPRMPVNPYLEWFIDYLAVNNLEVFAEIPADLISKKISDGRTVYLTRNGRTDSAAEYFCMCSPEFEGTRQDKYDGEGKKLFERLVRPSVLNAITRGIEKRLPPFDRPELVFRKKTIEWPAFSGAICAWQNKKRVTMEYTDLIFGYTVSQLVSDLRKYSENLLRKRLGIRSRYHVKDLSKEYKAIVDSFYRAAGITAEKKASEPAPEYEKFYETEATPLSVSEALDIERDAWKTTGALTDNSEFMYDEAETVAAAQPEDGEKAIAVETIAAILNGNDVSAIAKRENILTDTLIDRVNEFLYDVFGDNVIENGDINYYRDEVREWLSQQ
ncbi:MAG: TerB N-terminal domain-containing protein, partial [Clostridia bacterium]|nr:TerB N-terminal domain-containing protein [Clostridia bacterium]